MYMASNMLAAAELVLFEPDPVLGKFQLLPFICFVMVTVSRATLTRVPARKEYFRQTGGADLQRGRLAKAGGAAV